MGPPPKRRKVERPARKANSVYSRRRNLTVNTDDNTAQPSVAHASSNTSRNGNNAEPVLQQTPSLQIDYSKLAAEIIKQQNQPTVIQETTPSNLNPSFSTVSEQQNNIPEHDNINAQMNSNSHIQSLINNVLNCDSEKTETISVTKEEYWGKLYDFFEMQVEVYVHVKESENSHLEVYEYRLKRPDLKLEVPEKVEVGEPFEVKLSLTNPLHVTMTECSLDIEGNGIKSLQVKDLGSVAAGAVWKSVQSLTVKGRPKEIQISASFDCKELRDISGVTTIANVVSR